MAHYKSPRFELTEEDYEEDSDSLSQAHDQVRRNYLPNLHQVSGNESSRAQAQRELSTDAAKSQPKLGESYFAKERRALLNVLANGRQKISSLQMFNPAKNQSVKEEQQQWSENVSVSSGRHRRRLQVAFE